MTTYPVLTIDTAPDGARPALRGLQQAFGAVPNLAATMANSPPLVNSFVAAVGQFAGGTFSDGERQILLLSNAVANSCTWAVAFHSTLALKHGVADGDVEAVRHGRSPGAPRLAALSTLTRKLIERRGHLDPGDVEAFLAAGFDSDQLLEVITGVAISALANYAGNITRPPLEPAFQAQTWTAGQ
ncbi:MAG TPA: carboxymuconolactone decarboxylase family protein [Micromonosporaceae bacterium]|nr:carboxymuconolactone decarboxylase family protein [Micromonosporaceae bacterium]